MGLRMESSGTSGGNDGGLRAIGGDLRRLYDAEAHFLVRVVAKYHGDHTPK